MIDWSSIATMCIGLFAGHASAWAIKQLGDKGPTVIKLLQVAQEALIQATPPAAVQALATSVPVSALPSVVVSDGKPVS